MNNAVSLYKPGIGNFSISCVILHKEKKKKDNSFLRWREVVSMNGLNSLETAIQMQGKENTKFLWKFLRWHCDDIVMQTTSSQVSVKDQQKWEMK